MFTCLRRIFLIVFLTSFVCTSPVFFELYESSTKQEEVISDYRLTDKRLDEQKESHVEFYAEIIGKLVGSVRSGIKTFIEDLKMGKRDKNHLDDLDDRINQSKNGSTENQNENSTQVAQLVNEQNFCEDIAISSKDSTRHHFLKIFNDAMISILTLVRKDFIGQFDNFKNSSEIESCKNFLQNHLNILETIRIYKMERNTKYQLTLRRIFYKYARVYLRARKGYKDHQTSHHDFVRQNRETEELEELKANYLEKIDFHNFMTNDASRHDFKSIESIAILILEIFGALIAITLGLWTHLEQLDFDSF